MRSYLVLREAKRKNHLRRRECKIISSRPLENSRCRGRWRGQDEPKKIPQANANRKGSDIVTCKPCLNYTNMAPSLPDLNAQRNRGHWYYRLYRVWLDPTRESTVTGQSIPLMSMSFGFVYIVGILLCMRYSRTYLVIQVVGRSYFNAHLHPSHFGCHFVPARLFIPVAIDITSTCTYLAISPRICVNDILKMVPR